MPLVTGDSVHSDQLLKRWGLPSVRKPAKRKAKSDENTKSAMELMRQQVQELSAALDQEKKLRTASEHALQLMSTQLLNANEDNDRLSKELRDVNTRCMEVVKGLESKLDALTASRGQEEPHEETKESASYREGYKAGQNAYLNAVTFHDGFHRLAWMEREAHQQRCNPNPNPNPNGPNPNPNPNLEPMEP